jgi:putative sporulation protein YtaF
VDWLPVLLLALSVNLDNLGVGIAYGISRIAVPLVPNLLMAGIALLFTLLSGALGHVLARFMPEFVVRVLGALLLGGIGLYMISTSLRKLHYLRRSAPDTAARSDAGRTITPAGSVARMAGGSDAAHQPGLREILSSPEVADVDASRDISTSEAIWLGAAVSLNCLAGGLAAPWVGAPLLITALTTAVFSYLAIWSGVRLGHLPITRRLGDWSGVVAGLLLCLLALWEFA